MSRPPRHAAVAARVVAPTATRSRLRVGEKLLTIRLLMCTQLWPLAQWLNHELIPVELRVLWSNLIGLLWSTFLITRSRAAPLPLVPLFKMRSV